MNIVVKTCVKLRVKCFNCLPKLFSLQKVSVTSGPNWIATPRLLVDLPF